ncbi:DUF2585 domain-containing protein [Methyloligella sp. 2.7D]|uniref:DUF2585 domain-containing protein n=1 Tax=unclassified Methyloligella TaxID=2625955 RepID=UPI00157D0558|nr:DUF2585 domain-containing protein [Methyloligella sp. GL2]QKP77711.1 DUF2585 domain-containing protein [Methyloligella sp. GL2]
MRLTRTQLLIAFGIIVGTAAILLAMGRLPICKCGYVKLWEGEVMSEGNSQQLTDWYTPSHIIHGFIFYGVLWLAFGRRLSFGTRLILALVIESSWELVENSNWAIDRYREGTISHTYYGDSVLNSVMDILAMVVGFFLAAKWPVWVTVAVAVALELFTGVMTRDNLTLNVLMFVWPLDSVVEWQSRAFQ